MKENIQEVSFASDLFHFKIMISGPIHFPVNGLILFSTWHNKTPLCVYITSSSSIYLLVDDIQAVSIPGLLRKVL